MTRDFGWDLPPGVTSSMIPGNRPEDVAWERTREKVVEMFVSEVSVALGDLGGDLPDDIPDFLLLHGASDETILKAAKALLEDVDEHIRSTTEGALEDLANEEPDDERI